MSSQLQDLKPHTGAKKKRKTVGRGNGSGHGTFSTRGSKGQKARSGGGKGALKIKGMRHIILAAPKKRGFRSMYAKNETVNLETLEKRYNVGETVSPQTLLDKKLISFLKAKIKILGTGEITKKLEVVGCTVTNSAKEKITKVGGEIK